jgi:transcriptional regulator with GAF, ATPase, and Fis domain
MALSGTMPTVSTSLLRGNVKELRFHRFVLRVVDGLDKGREYASSSAAEISVGTAESNALVLTDPTVSRYHFVLQVSPQGVILRDLDSTNGTQLGGFRVGTAYLTTGATIALGMTRLRYDELPEQLDEPLSADDYFGRILGKSVAMRRIFSVLPRIAAADTTVLLEGETGTGKSVLAEAIHGASARAAKPFVVVDCGSIPPALIESELFGHERGAFTGATRARAGAFESAAGGTVFLDELGELPLELQPKLLRALEERAVKRVGGSDLVRLDMRVIAASNRNLRQAVNRGTFRADLYFRLNIVRIEVPPLRERRDDIALLVASFYEQLAQPPGSQPPPGLVEHLASQDWPGNVRELRNAVERAVLMQDAVLWQELTSESTSTTDTAYRFDDALSFRAAKERATALWERWYIGELVQRSGGNLSRAARDAHMDRTHLRELVRKYQLDKK